MHELRCRDIEGWCRWDIAWHKGKFHNVEVKRITLVTWFGGYVVVLICSKKQVKIRSNGSKSCSLWNGEFFGLNIRNKLLKSFINERENVSNLTIWETELSIKLSFALFNEFIWKLILIGLGKQIPLNAYGPYGEVAFISAKADLGILYNPYLVLKGIVYDVVHTITWVNHVRWKCTGRKIE